jgi:hypothetical protein
MRERMEAIKTRMDRIMEIIHAHLLPVQRPYANTRHSNAKAMRAPPIKGKSP